LVVVVLGLVVVVPDLFVVVVTGGAVTVVVGVTAVLSATMALSVRVLGGLGLTLAGSKAMVTRSSGANLIDAGFVVVLGFAPNAVQ
jgi:hypothetical protein